MENLRALKIIHDRRNRVLYNVIAEFFRFCGVFVLEEKVDDLSNYDQVDDTQFIILFSKEAAPEIKQKKPTYKIDTTDYEILEHLTLEQAQLDQEPVIHGIEELFTDIFKAITNNGIQIPVEMIQELLSVFLKTDVVIAASNLQYYRMISKIHEKSNNIFEDAIEKLESMKEKIPYLGDFSLTEQEDSDRQAYFVYHYALLYCKQKVNLACWFLKDGEYNLRRGNGELCNEYGFLREVRLKYRVSELFGDCKKLIEQYPQNANLYVLMGMITERASDGYQVAADAYQQALEMIGDQPYASHIYYWLGWVHERQGGNLSEAKKAYAKAYLLQKKYRNIYKVAVMFEREKNYERFREYLVMCCENLIMDQEIKMDPLEMEYYCKTCILLSIRSLQYRNDADTAIQYGEEVLEFFRKHIQEDEAGEFRSFYGMDADIYRTESQERISFRMVYETLAVAYQMKEDMEKSDEYRRKYSLGSL